MLQQKYEKLRSMISLEKHGKCIPIIQTIQCDNQRPSIVDFYNPCVFCNTFENQLSKARTAFRHDKVQGNYVTVLEKTSRIFGKKGVSERNVEYVEVTRQCLVWLLRRGSRADYFVRLIAERAKRLNDVINIYFPFST